MAIQCKQLKRLTLSAVLAAICIAFSSSCVTTAAVNVRKKPVTAAAAHKRQPVSPQDLERIATIAQRALGQPSLKIGKKHFRADCSGTVRAIYTRARVGLGGILKSNAENDVKAIYRYVQKYGKIHRSAPAPGELVFFHNTYDRSRNGRMNDALTHIGIVERVEGGTVHFIHHLGHAIIRSRMIAWPKWWWKCTVPPSTLSTMPI